MENQVTNSSQDMSPSIGALAAALSIAQGQMKSATKDSNNPFFKSKYADLTSVWDAIRGPLSNNKLAVFQTTSNNNGDIVVITTLAHSSGEWIRGTLALKPVKTDPQAIGSAITYGRRYALASICGVAPEDDDGIAASQPAKSVLPAFITKDQAEILIHKIASTKTDSVKFCKAYQIDRLENLSAGQFQDALAKLQKKEVPSADN